MRGFRALATCVLMVMLAGCSSAVDDSSDAGAITRPSAAPSPSGGMESSKSTPIDTEVPEVEPPVIDPGVIQDSTPLLTVEEVIIPGKNLSEFKPDEMSRYSPFDEDAWGPCNRLYGLDRIFNVVAGPPLSPQYPRSINRAVSVQGADFKNGSIQLGGNGTQVQERLVTFKSVNEARKFISGHQSLSNSCGRLKFAFPQSVQSASGIEEETKRTFEITARNTHGDKSLDWQRGYDSYWKDQTNTYDDSSREFGRMIQRGKQVLIARVIGQNYGKIGVKKAMPVIEVMTDKFLSTPPE